MHWFTYKSVWKFSYEGYEHQHLQWKRSQLGNLEMADGDKIAGILLGLYCIGNPSDFTLFHNFQMIKQEQTDLGTSPITSGMNI